ncbi:ABC transporter permease [Dyadobacter arcticus]|uniref:Permease n=1 Tax=Dyadobacter arcticus TaxID=1078754 RepID=A0ABX0UID7_9BACT|nr:ABC transporter permease [Dyadobacter arcticus]NIJ51824.1 putative permease [Dyadobacter arcticus]
MLTNYIKISLRNVLNNKVYSGINIAGLSIGLSCCLAIGLYIFDELSFDRFHVHFDSTYRLIEKQKQSDGLSTVAVTPGPLAPTMSKDFPEVMETARVGLWSGILSNGKQVSESENMLIVDPSFFKVFTFPLVAGNVNKVFRGINEVIISEVMAGRLFGPNWKRAAIIGKTVSLNNDQALTLVGVAKNPPANSHLQFDVLLPFNYLVSIDEWSNKWNSNNFHTYIRLRPETNAASFEEKIKLQVNRYTDGNDVTLLLQPLADIYLKSKFDFKTDWGKRSEILYVRIFLTVALIILLIAVVNFVNLATARASKRAKEVGVRKTVGAQKSSLIIQFLSESFLMTISAVGVALILAQAYLPAFNTLSGKQLSLPIESVNFWLALTAITLVVSFLTGLYPAFFLSAFRPVSVLKGVFDIKSGKSFRQSMVVGQFTLSIALAIGTLVIYQQLNFIQNKKLGFDQSQLMFVSLKGELKSKAIAFKQDMMHLAGVERASATTSNLVDVTNSTKIEWEGQAPKDEFLITQMNIDGDFLQTTGMSLAAGRNFSDRISADTSGANGNYIINETAAKRMGWTSESALGKTVKFWGSAGKIVGVFKDFHFRPLQVAIEPFIFRYRPVNFYFSLLIKTKPGSLKNTLAEIGKVYKKYDPNYPISYGFVDQELKTLYKTEQRTGEIVLNFSMLAILISCLGLFGLATFTAEQRTKEIGVRKVLGASIAGIVGLLSKDFLKLVAIAIVIASPVAWWLMNQWLQGFAYRIDIEWWMFAAAAISAVLIAIATVSFQSIKAALMNPVRALRSE